ncbi:MAG: DUF1289 domain-containing protein [Sphingomonadaceae bacterium]|nr:DUF1289 domain-containing protein [Sphingomonadaceae bacterium]
MTVPSPCTKVCEIAPRSRLCRGCRRTIDEIMAWPSASDEEKRRILAALPARRP